MELPWQLQWRKECSLGGAMDRYLGENTISMEFGKTEFCFDLGNWIGCRSPHSFCGFSTMKFSLLYKLPFPLHYELLEHKDSLFVLFVTPAFNTDMTHNKCSINVFEQIHEKLSGYCPCLFVASDCWLSQGSLEKHTEVPL